MYLEKLELVNQLVLYILTAKRVWLFCETIRMESGDKEIA